MHTIDLSKFSLRTDLIIENKKDNSYEITSTNKDNIKIEKTISKEKDEHYTTILFDDITDKDNVKKVEQILRLNYGMRRLQKFT